MIFQKTMLREICLPSVVAARPHFHETCLVEGTAVDVDSVPVVGGPDGQSLVVFHRLLDVLGVVLVNVVVGPDGELELVVDNLAGALRTGTAHKHHDPCAAVGIRTLKH